MVSETKKGIVDKYYPSKIGIPGIRLSGGSRFYNAPQGSSILGEDLVGQQVEFILDDVLGDGNLYITSLKPEYGDIRRVGDKAKFVEQGFEFKAKMIVDEWFVIYKRLCDKLVPKNVEAKDHYAIREKEQDAAYQATELLKLVKQK